MQPQTMTITQPNTDGLLLAAVGVTVTFYTDAARTVVATIYSDDGVTAIPGAVLITDAQGRISWYGPDTDLWWRVTSGPSTLDEGGPIQHLDLEDPTPRTSSVSRVEKLMVAAAGASPLATLANSEACVAGQLYANGLTAILKPHHDITHYAFGADPTGVADSTAAIQNALAYAAIAGSTRVYAPRGTYRYSRFTIPAGLTLFGDGPTKTIFQTTQALGASGTQYTTSSIACSTIGASDSDGCEIHSIAFQRHSSMGAGSDVMYLNLSNMTRAAFSDLRFSGGGGAGVTWAFSIGNGASNGTMYAKMCSFSRCLMLGGVDDRFIYTRSDGGTGYATALSVEDCWLENMKVGIQWDGRTKCCLVTKCLFDGFDSGIFNQGQNNVAFANYFIDGTLGVNSAIRHVAGTYQSKALANMYDGIADVDGFQTGVGVFNGQSIDGGRTNVSPHLTRFSRMDNDISEPGSPGFYGDLCLREVGPGLNRIYLGGSSATTPQILLGTADPSVTATTAGVGSVYLRTGTLTTNTPRIFVKYATGSTDWMPVGDSIIDNAGTPVGAVTPNYIGQLCRNTTPVPDDFYIAVGLTNTDWEQITP